MTKQVENPEESVSRLKAEQEIAGKEVPVVLEQSFQLSELEALKLENLQLKDQILKKQLTDIEIEMGGLVENIKKRLKLPEGAVIRFSRDNTVVVTEK